MNDLDKALIERICQFGGYVRETTITLSEGQTLQMQGLTVLDQIAITAMAGIISHEWHLDAVAKASRDRIATEAYDMAEAMLKVRSARLSPPPTKDT